MIDCWTRKKSIVVLGVSSRLTPIIISRGQIEFPHWWKNPNGWQENVSLEECKPRKIYPRKQIRLVDITGTEFLRSPKYTPEFNA